jgi:hypothetical protein
MTCGEYQLKIASLGLTPLGRRIERYDFHRWRDGRTYPIRHPDDLSPLQRDIWIQNYNFKFPFA